MDVNVTPLEKRKVVFEVDQEEAKKIVGLLRDVIDARVNTPYSYQHLRTLMSGFAVVADGRAGYGGN